MQQKSRLKLRYCPMVDCFIKVREFSPEEIEAFFQSAKIQDKRSYQELVVLEAIPEFDSKVLSLIQSDPERGIDLDSAVEELYRMCIKVNPGLNIYNVSIPVQDKDEPSSRRPAVHPQDLNGRIKAVRGIEEALRTRVVGQEEAIQRVAQCVKSGKIGIKDPNRPVACFLFAGQTGVGKTELAKALAEFLTGHEKNMVRVDCSEFAQPHEYSKLIGAPPGYVGYDDGGSLIEPLLKMPGNVVLFDEVEKADSKLHNLLLQVMDEGALTDNKGRKIPFRDAVVVMTSNVGVEGIEEMKHAVGFNLNKSPGQALVEHETLKSLNKAFRPEFLNRIDDIICFSALGDEEYRSIVKQLLARLRLNLAELNVSIRFTKGVTDFLVRSGTHPEYGARPLKRAVKKFIEAPLTERILQEETPTPDKILVKMSGGQVVFVEDVRGSKNGSRRSNKNSKRKGT